jgi:hypothetical protein
MPRRPSKRKPPECHPDRKYYAGGLCKPCFQLAHPKEKKNANLGRAARKIDHGKSDPQRSEVRAESQDLGGTVRELPQLHTGTQPPAQPLPVGPEPDTANRLVRSLGARVVENNKSVGNWKGQFPEVDPAKLTEHYYKSECRPLKLLKPFHRFGQEARNGHRGPHLHSLTFRAWLDLRDRARKDLYWLGKHCIGTEMSGSNFMEHVHREMCEQFVQKDFDGVYHKGYTLMEMRLAIGRQKREKEMLLLAPRGSFKSTVNKLDAVQWLLNCPDIRILVLTGAFNLAEKFLKEIKGFFYKPDGIGYTYFQALFPEYVLEGVDGVSGAALTCPARICRQEGQPSLWVNSIGGTVAGWHCDVMKGDDIVNEENSNNEDTRETLKDRYDNASENLPDEWAFRDHIGTRYFSHDWYGTRIKDFQKYESSDSLRFLSRSAWIVKPEFEDVPIKALKAHMVDLYFPEKLTFNSLIQKCRHNEKLFRCQLLNQPMGDEAGCDFKEEALNEHLLLLTRVPYPTNGKPRQVVIEWDTGHSGNADADYCAGAAGWCQEDTRKLFVLEIRAGKYADSVLADNIVDMHLKWKAMFTEIEAFPRHGLLGAEIQRVAMRKCGTRIPIVWRPVEQGLNAKRNRVKGLESLLSDDRLYFVEGDWIDLTFQQFIKFTGFSRRRKDDIPDAISFLQKLIPAEQVPHDENEESEAARKAREARELREAFARQHNDSAYQTIFSAPPAPPAPEPEEKTFEDEGPSRIFGGIGIHL